MQAFCLIFIFLLQCGLCLNISVHYKKIPKNSKYDSNQDSTLNEKIVDAKNLFICITDEDCRLIKEFQITPDNRFSCYELNVKLV